MKLLQNCGKTLDTLDHSLAADSEREARVESERADYGKAPLY
jgi:hypothetical protein